MRLIKPSVEILEQGPGLQGVYDMIELCGKTSYKSEVKGGEEAKKFVDARVNEGHLAVLEFGTVYLRIPAIDWNMDEHEWYYMFPEGCPWAALNSDKDWVYITTNFRYALEVLGIKDITTYWHEPTDGHIKRYCARFITDRGVSHELVRHRAFSFCQESTRYCNYSKDKFGKELTFIEPAGMKFRESTDCLTPGGALFLKSCREAEDNYMEFLDRGFTPQQARAVLPNAIKTEICMCGFEDDWKHFFDLRYRGTTGKPHPDMLCVATMLHDKFKEKGVSL